MRIVVIGAGAMGSLFGGLLKLGGLDVILVEKNRDIIDAVRRNGILVLEDGSTLNISDVDIVDDGSMAWPADYAIILVKSYHTKSAALEAEKALDRNGIAVTLQNGLGNVETLAGTLGWNRVLAGVTTWGATLIKPGVVRLGGRGHVKIGAPRGEPDDSVYRLVEAFNRAGLNAGISDNIMRDVWVKVAINAAINPLTALTRARNGEILEDPILLDIGLKAACEAVRVARAEGVDVPDCSYVEDVVVNVMKATSSNFSSMLQDVAGCRRTEIEAISGEVYRRGMKHGIDVSVNRILYGLVKNLEPRACRDIMEGM